MHGRQCMRTAFHAAETHFRRCGCKQLPLFFPVFSDTMIVSIASEKRQEMLTLSVPDNYIGTVSSTMFGGMMVGAVGWGTCTSNSPDLSVYSTCIAGSDLLGRSMAFNLTLFFTALFGLLISFSNSFFSLCFMLFLLGTAVGVRLNFGSRTYILTKLRARCRLTEPSCSNTCQRGSSIS